MSSTTTPLTLVTAAGGKTGSRVAARLAAAGRPVRAGSRRTEPPFDWTDPGTWAPALDGVTAAYLAYVPDVAFPGGAEAVDAFAALAVQRGVGRLVLLSGRGEANAERAEQRVRESGADWTIVRSAVFAQNFSEGVFAEAIASGVLPMHVDDVPEPFVDVDDLADVAAAAFLDDRHIGQLYEVTGPRLLTFTEALTEIGATTGRTAAYVRISPEEMRAGIVEAGLPDEEAEALVVLLAEILDGRNASIADGVERALGRPPRDFREYARDAAASGVWTAGAVAR